MVTRHRSPGREALAAWLRGYCWFVSGHRQEKSRENMGIQNSALADMRVVAAGLAQVPCSVARQRELSQRRCPKSCARRLPSASPIGKAAVFSSPQLCGFPVSAVLFLPEQLAE